jgi:post-segregation antitoxin (ccd killing protein)
MSVQKLSISLPGALATSVRAEAKASGVSVSAWVAQAIRAQLRHRALGEFLVAWEAEHGPLTAEELADGYRTLGLTPPRESGQPVLDEAHRSPARLQSPRSGAA